ncbi:MAG TPA: hypothetical protein PLQ34_09710, partial [Ferrovaceae bacterium]|nr:hypothetical protein [Ferrovaceae bacterium]
MKSDTKVGRKKVRKQKSVADGSASPGSHSQVEGNMVFGADEENFVSDETVYAAAANKVSTPQFSYESDHLGGDENQDVDYNESEGEIGIRMLQKFLDRLKIDSAVFDRAMSSLDDSGSHLFEWLITQLCLTRDHVRYFKHKLAHAQGELAAANNVKGNLLAQLADMTSKNSALLTRLGERSEAGEIEMSGSDPASTKTPNAKKASEG